MKPLRFRLLRQHGGTRSCLIRAGHPDGLTSPAYCCIGDVRHLRSSDIRRIYREELRAQLEHLEKRLFGPLGNPPVSNPSQPIQP